MKEKCKCKCKFCIRTRDFKERLESVDDPELKAWMVDFYGYTCELEEMLSVHQIYHHNLKTLYPKIWKETTTIRKLHKDEAQFPEKQI